MCLNKKSSLFNSFLRCFPPLMGLVTLSIPEKTWDAVFPMCTSLKCLDTVAILVVYGLVTSKKCLLIRTLSGVVVHPTYCTQQALHATRYITNFELQLINSCMGKVLPLLAGQKDYVRCAKPHAVHCLWPQPKKPFDESQVCWILLLLVKRLGEIRLVIIQHLLHFVVSY